MRLLALLSLLGAGCASAPARSPSSPTLPSDFPRSSIAAVLAHRTELGPSDVQVEAMQRRDEQLQRENDALRARTTRTAASASSGSPPPSGGHAGGRHPPRSAGSPTRAPGDPLTRIDDNDTRAYLEVEEGILTAAQRPRAQEIASRYREALYDWQHPRPGSRNGQTR